MTIPRRKGEGPFGLLTRIHDLQSYSTLFRGAPGSGMKTDLTRDGQPVIFLHSPKTGGTSVGKLLHVPRRSHTFASSRLTEKHWLNSYSIAIVRDPFQRFLSGYYGHILRDERNGLVKIYGWGIHDITPREYLDVLDRNPKYGGLQTLWTDYPSREKPRADLILRFEELHRAKETLIAAGVDVSGRDLPHINKGERGQADHLERLNMTRSEFDALERDVRAYYATDYAAFGYA